jgi:hypothetical protein
MQMLSEDDVNLRELSDEELDLAWDLWFDLAQTTNDWDPPYSHGVFVNLVRSPRALDKTPPHAAADVCVPHLDALKDP